MSTDLQNRLKNFEATPPDHIWPKIEAALDQQSEPALEKLYTYEEEPAPLIWNKIEKELDAAPTSKAKVVTISRHKTYKFAIAAAIFILAIAGINYLFSNKQGGEIAVNQPTKNSTSRDSNKNASATDVKNLTLQSNDAVADNAPATKENTTVATPNKLIANRYTTIEDEKGKVVRLSKKVIPVFDCADNEKAKENSHCKEDITTLQRKMATSSLASSADFAGLIDMLKDLKENKN